MPYRLPLFPLSEEGWKTYSYDLQVGEEIFEVETVQEVTIIEDPEQVREWLQERTDMPIVVPDAPRYFLVRIQQDTYQVEQVWAQDVPWYLYSTDDSSVSGLVEIEGRILSMRVLLFPGIERLWIEQIQAISPEIEVVTASSETEALSLISQVDALYGRITPALLSAAPRLRWVQVPHIGLEGTIFPELAASSVVLTNARGIYSDHVADQAFSMLLSFARGLHVYMRRQVEHRWASLEKVQVIHLPDQTLGIIGLGGIGSEVAKRGRSFGMRVVAVDPAPKGSMGDVDRVRGLDGLYQLLRESDFVVICAPHTPVTEGLIGATELRAMKRTAVLINVGRGVIVKLEALVEALRAGTIAGAGLDVFEVEPLPEDHPLWDMENVIITPHVGARGPYVQERRMRIFIENVRRSVAGEPLLNVVDKAQWC